MDERSTCERLVTYDTSTLEGIGSAAGFVKGWLEARDVEVTGTHHNDRPVLAATVGASSGPTVLLHGHLDVVPGHSDQFEPRVDGDRLYGRGAYDMKGALAAMLLSLHDRLVEEGFLGDFAITGEPTDMHIGVQAKGVLAVRLEVSGRAAHGSTPWLGDNAVLKAIDVFRSIESLPFSRESSAFFDRPSINLGRIMGGDALNKVPDRCVIDVDIRYLPDQDLEEILGQVTALPECNVISTFTRAPASVGRDSPYLRALSDAASAAGLLETMSVG